MLVNFIRPSLSKIFNIRYEVGIKLLPRLQLDFNHLRERKFRHNFEDTLNALSSFSIEPERTMYFSLCSQFYRVIRQTIT